MGGPGPTLGPRVAEPSGEIELSENTSAEGPARADTGCGGSELRFLGGPLDGRVDVRAARHGDPLPTVTHVHLHDGPKVVHRYDLDAVGDGAAVYRLRPPVRRPVADEAATG